VLEDALAAGIQWLFFRFPAMSKLSQVTADSHHVERARLLGVDDLLDATVNGIRIVVVTNAGP
jgi:hypothetical protein